MKKFFIYALAVFVLCTFAVSYTDSYRLIAADKTEKTNKSDEIQPSDNITEGATVTFEDGFLWTAECIGDNDFQDDESECRLEIQELFGSKQLKIEVLSKSDDGNYKVPKIRFDVDKLVGKNNVSRIKTVSLDVTITADGTFLAESGEELFVPGNCIGRIYANSGEDGKMWTTLAEFGFEEWKLPYASKHIVGNILLPSTRYFDGQEGCTLIFMRWPIPNRADIYIDNLTFYDDDGNPVMLEYDPSSELKTEN